MKGITLTRQQEVALIEIGMNTLLRNLPSTTNHKEPRKKIRRRKRRTMSAAARKAISRRMKAMWKEKRAASK